VDEHGQHLYARFLWQLRRPELAGRLPKGIPLLSQRHDGAPVLLRTFFTHYPYQLFDDRLASLIHMFIHRLISRDAMTGSPAERKLWALEIEDAYGMMAAALELKPSDQLVQLAEELSRKSPGR